MTLDEILSEWEQDAKIDPLDLFNESLNRIKLHAKYLRIQTDEKKAFWVLERKYKVLRADKKEFLINPTKEVMEEKKWVLPARGRLLKNEVEEFLNTDSELLDLELKLTAQQEKIDVLKSILGELRGRGFDIKNAIEDRKFRDGG